MSSVNFVSSIGTEMYFCVLCFNKEGDHLSGKPGNVREFDS